MSQKISKTPLCPLVAHVPVDLRNAVVAAAEMSGTSMSSIITRALRASIGKASTV